MRSRGRLAAFAVAALALVAPTPAGAQEVSASEARAQAHEILDQARYKGAGLPRPLEKPIGWLADRLEPLIDRINNLGGDVPGGPPVVWTLLAILVLLLASMITSTSIRRRAIAIERERAAAVPEADNPQALEREASKAERDGQWERAVRLRFRAGLLRLDRRKVLVYRPSLTTGEVARTLKEPAFDEVGTRFDEIAYGGRAAEREDAEASERGWQDVLEAVARR